MKEENLYLQIATYLRAAYPRAIFRFDVGAGIKLTMGQAMKFKRMQSGRGYPDLFIAHPTVGFGGMYLEIKKADVKLKRDKDAKKPLTGEVKIRKAGDWFDAHLEEQAAVLESLRQAGYFAEFAVGFDQAKRLIDGYFRLGEFSPKSFGS